MRKTIKQLEADVQSAKRDSNEYKNMLEQIRSVIFPSSSAYTHSFNSILPELVKLVGYKAHTEGAYRPENETIHILKEIIRWEINPETAMESKVQERMNGIRQ